MAALNSRKADTKRIKSPAATWRVPQSREDVNADIARIGELQREKARYEADMNDEMAAIKKRYEEAAQPLLDELQGRSAGVKTYCEAHRIELTGEKTKTVGFQVGEVSWRARPPSVSVRGVEAVIDTLKRLGLGRFVRSKEEVNKEAILNEPEAIKGVAGLGINSGLEDFVIKPFETELEQVAE